MYLLYPCTIIPNERAAGAGADLVMHKKAKSVRIAQALVGEFG